MKEYIKQYINNLTNPLLYYVHKDEYSVFKNFCLFKNNGNFYNRVIPVKDAGAVLEYRMYLSKKFRLYSIILTILVYFIFIRLLYNFGGFLLCEIIWIVLFFFGRIYCSEKYKEKLIQNFGEYSITDFNPPVSEEKSHQYLKNYIARVAFIGILLTVFIGFSFILRGIIIHSANKEKPNYNNAEILSAIYTKIYPEIPVIYEIRAKEDYIAGDFDRASKNYIKAIGMYGEKFTEKDYVRFANLLYLVKKSNGSQNAIDIFNEYATQKNTNIQQRAKLLWIKSMFSISSGLPDFVVNDYDDLIASLNPQKDKKNEFYILSDKAYMLYLMRNYKDALSIYNTLIPYALKNKKIFENDIPRLYAERGFTKKQLKDNTGGNSDFLSSKIDLYEIKKYEPKISETGFIAQKF